MNKKFQATCALLMAGFATTAAPAHLKAGDPANAYTVSTFDKHKFTSDDLRGQVVVINLWATWCGPCRRELPALDAYYRQHYNEGLRVFAVATEDSVPDYQLRKLSDALAFPLSHRISGHGFETLGGVPTSYVIDRAGVVRYAKADAFDAQSLDAVIGPLLAEPAPAVTAVTASH